MVGTGEGNDEVVVSLSHRADDLGFSRSPLPVLLVSLGNSSSISKFRVDDVAPRILEAFTELPARATNKTKSGNAIEVQDFMFRAVVTDILYYGNLFELQHCFLQFLSVT